MAANSFGVHAVCSALVRTREPASRAIIAAARIKIDLVRIARICIPFLVCEQIVNDIRRVQRRQERMHRCQSVGATSVLSWSVRASFYNSSLTASALLRGHSKKPNRVAVWKNHFCAFWCAPARTPHITATEPI